MKLNCKSLISPRNAPTWVAAAALLVGCSGDVGSGGITGSTAGAMSGGTTMVNPDGSTTVTNPDGTTTTVTDPDATAAGDTGGTATDTGGGFVTSGIACSPGVPGTSQLPVLTKVQYDNTVRDLLGIDNQPSQFLAPDVTGSVDQRAWDGFQSAAAAIATDFGANADARARVITCTPDADGAACANQIIAELGQRAFRRPLSDAETTRFQALYTNRVSLTETGSFDEAVNLIVEAFLVSPSFLTRAEITEQAQGDYYALSNYEVASRLSYLLWGSMPDQALFDAAAAGTLSTPEEILVQAQRMLQDSRARTQVAAFHREYAHMGPMTRWSEISRDTNTFPAFSPELVPVISQETEMIFDHVVFDLGGSFQDLMTSNVAFVNASIAPLYGLDASQFGADLTQTTLDGSRPGVFTRVGFLTSHSSFDRTSPILRGAFLQKEVLCAEIPPPPADAESEPLPTEGLTTNRERVDAQTSAPACVSCHLAINPTGFALESFDAIGAVQATDNGAPVDTTADVVMGDDTVAVTGPADLMTSIANHPAAQRCYADKWVQYAFQREANAQDACLVDELTGRLTAGGYTVLNLIADLTQSEAFRYRALETEAAQ